MAEDRPIQVAHVVETAAGTRQVALCLPRDIVTDVVRVKDEEHHTSTHAFRVFRIVSEITGCRVEVVSASVSVRPRAWEVSVLVRITVGYRDAAGVDHLISRLRIVRKTIPWPLGGDWFQFTPIVEVSNPRCDDVRVFAIDGVTVIEVDISMDIVVKGLKREQLTVCELVLEAAAG